VRVGIWRNIWMYMCDKGERREGGEWGYGGIYGCICVIKEKEEKGESWIWRNIVIKEKEEKGDSGDMEEYMDVYVS